MTNLEGWAVNTLFGLADHTYVRCPPNGQFFDCWGGHAGNNNRAICQGNGIYDVADCYRRPVTVLGRVLPDTAGIGVYGIHGVCHQSTNCFLFSAGAVLDNTVGGYWFSSILYGVYGRRFHHWQNNIYNPCFNLHQNAPHGKTATPPPSSKGNDLFELIHTGYKNQKVGKDTKPNEIIVMDAATLFVNAVDLRPQIYEDMHRRLLKKKDEIVESSSRTEELVGGINNLSKEFQKSIADLFEDEVKDTRTGLYEQLTGLKIGETVDIIDSKIAESASEEIEKYLQGKK
jgi:hypothetical protein